MSGTSFDLLLVCAETSSYVFGYMVASRILNLFVGVFLREVL